MLILASQAPFTYISCQLPRRTLGVQRKPLRAKAFRIVNVISPVKEELTAHPTMDSEAKAELGMGATRAAIDSALTTDIPQENGQEIALQVDGKFPEWLDGTLARLGPGTFRNMVHLFDGYGMLLKIRFSSGKVFAANRFVQSGSWKAYRAAGDQPRFSEFGTSVAVWRNLKNTLQYFLGIGQGITDNASVSVLPLADGKTAVAMTEVIPGQYLMDLTNMNTLKQLKFKDDVKGMITTAHPAKLPNGDIVNFVSDIGGSTVVFRSQPGSEKRTILAKIKLRFFPNPCWIHDFPHTENYVIIPETPCIFDLKSLLVGGASEYVSTSWQGDKDVLLHVVPLDGSGKVRTFHAPTYFTFHYMNAFESADGSKIHIDVSHYKDPEILNNLRLANMRSGTRDICDGPLRRMTIDLNDLDKVATVEPLMKDDSYIQSELPRVHPSYKGKAYRYGYSAAGVRPTSFGNALVKFDLETGEHTMWHEPGSIPTEPVMVPRSEKEDDGVVLSVVTGADGKSFLLALDAASFQELGRAHVPFTIAYQFHGNWTSGAADGKAT